MHYPTLSSDGPKHDMTTTRPYACLSPGERTHFSNAIFPTLAGSLIFRSSKILLWILTNLSNKKRPKLQTEALLLWSCQYSSISTFFFTHRRRGRSRSNSRSSGRLQNSRASLWRRGHSALRLQPCLSPILARKGTSAVATRWTCSHGSRVLWVMWSPATRCLGTLTSTARWRAQGLPSCGRFSLQQREALKRYGKIIQQLGVISIICENQICFRLSLSPKARVICDPAYHQK